MTKQVWPAPERNKGPILEVLQRVLPARGTVLEIASGTGQHAAHFAAHLPNLTFQPSDLDPENLLSIESWVQEAALPNLRAPIPIDVCAADWNVGTVDALFCANMVHIAPWACCVGLIEGAGRHLTETGVFVVYGPFKFGGEHTAASNASFDESLKARNPEWGVRDVEALQELARGCSFELTERVQMPANNQTLVFRRRN